MHPTKIGIIIRDDLLDWQKLNVTAFLASGVVASTPESTGEAYEDDSGGKYMPLFKEPVWVFTASREQLKRTLDRAKTREVLVGIYTEDMFTTDNDIDNRAVIKNVDTDNLKLVGLVLRTERKVFDKIIAGLKRHP